MELKRKEASDSKNVVLKANHRLPSLIMILGIVLICLPVSKWASISITIFGLFLLLQSFILRLEFTSDELIVWQLSKQLRIFPYKDWLAWRLFFPELPGIFYFREEASPHLLPILFDPKQLQDQLRKKLKSLEVPKTANGSN